MIDKKIKEGVSAKAKPRGRPQAFCREQALDAALSVFCENGYEATSVAMLCEAMKIKPPSLYHSFGDKERLFIDALRSFHAPHKEAAAQIFAEAKTAQEAMKKLFALAESYHAHVGSLGCLIANSTINASDTQNPIAQTIKELLDINEAMIRARLEQGQKDGDFSGDVDVPALARYVNGVIQGAAILGRGQQSPDAVRDLLNQGYEALIRLLGTA